MLSLVATGGGLVFGGDANGRFRAFDDTHRQGAVGDEPRRAGQRLPDHVRGGRQAVRGGGNRSIRSGERDTSRHSGASPEHGRAGLRFCPTLTIVNSQLPMYLFSASLKPRRTTCGRARSSRRNRFELGDRRVNVSLTIRHGSPRCAPHSRPTAGVTRGAPRSWRSLRFNRR